MKIYQLILHDAQEGSVLTWHPSKDRVECEKRRVLADDDHPDPTFSVCVHDIEPTKAGFLRWLNSHFTLDNG